MKIIADLHIHSKYSRAVSQEMTLENIGIWAQRKGLKVVGTGDFTHPEWFRAIKEKLKEQEPGLFILREAAPEKATRFMLTTEIASIYSKNHKMRRIHNLIFAPSLKAVERINTKLSWVGNLKADGRPILGLDSKELLKIILDADPRCVLVPAHAWTPWFSIFGSMSGFDSIEECFDEMSKYIFSIETGLSSDPAMNWRLSALDKITLISNSDSHSLERIGREANVFDCDLSYDAIIDAIRAGDPRRFLFTIEFFPEEGKYHYDGHRNCKVSQSPEQTKKNGGICPVCGKKLTIGVLNRVEQLADRPAGFKPAGAIPFKSLVQLDEIIADVLGVGAKSKSVQGIYNGLINKIGSELKVLLEASQEQIAEAGDARIAEGVIRVREGRVKLIPGFDGEYGKISIFDEGEESSSSQPTLFG